MDKVAYSYSDIYIHENLDLDNVLNGKIVIIYDNNVESYILSYVDRFLSYGFDTSEESKTISTFTDIATFLTLNNVTRDYLIVAIGGGITLDIVGYTASSYMRGTKVTYIPTTLLAMVDASIGGKCGVNFLKKKNYLGSFYHPQEVHVFPQFLETLDENEISNGMAEVIKIALVKDKHLFEELKGNIEMSTLIKKAIELKVKIVLEDILDNGYRRVLNFGHTIGHALEEISKYELPHGFCVGIAISYKMQSDEIDYVLHKYGLFTRDDFDLSKYRDTIIELVKFDKKNDENINVTVVKEIGEGEVVSVQDIDTIIKW